MNAQPKLREILIESKTQTGESLDELSRRSPVLVVFLRHTGCPFTREALADLAAQRAAIETVGARLVLVHMVDEAKAKTLFEQRGMGDVLRISDPGQQLYQAFELRRGSMWEVAGPGMWWRGIKTVFSGHGFGVPEGDVLQLPGAFLLQDGQIIKAYRHQSSSDRPDYSELAQCPLSQGESGSQGE